MVLGHRRHSLTSSRSSADDSRGDEGGEDETVVDSEQGNMLMHIISQLRPGADLSRVTLPTFILEPRSMLERITNFMAHPDTLLPMTKIDDPIRRFVAVVRFYLSGWHIKPPGVKKPLNPILGEIFTGYWDYPDGTRGYYISEQTSHHPPKSSYFFMAPEHHIRIDGTLKPRSKFLGNSAASMMEGIAVMRLLNTGERYFVTQPNMYARGILFGKMKYELGDHSFVRSPELGLAADLEFKTKGYFGGTYDAIGGFITDMKTNKNLFELSGHWNREMYIKDLTTGKKELLFDATHAKEMPPKARPLEEQDERESQRLWRDVTEAIKQKDQDAATDAKSRIEDRQREETAKRMSDGIDWHPQLFRRVHGGQGGSEEGEEDLDWVINAKIDAKTPEEQVKQILQIAAILPGQTPHRQFNIPTRSTSQTNAENPQQSQPEPQAMGDLIDLNEPAPTAHAPVQHASIQQAPQAPVSQAPIPQETRPQELQEPPKPVHSELPSRPQESPQPIQPGSSKAEDLMKGIPPSKLLHSTPGQPPRGANTVRRADSQTHMDEEFHDALS